MKAKPVRKVGNNELIIEILRSDLPIETKDMVIKKLVLVDDVEITQAVPYQTANRIGAEDSLGESSLSEESSDTIL